MSVSTCILPALFRTITSQNGFSFLSYSNVNFMSLYKLFKMEWHVIISSSDLANGTKQPFPISSKFLLKFCIIVGFNDSV